MIVVITVIIFITMVVAVLFAMVVVVREFAVVGSRVRNTDARKDSRTKEQRNDGAEPRHTRTSSVARTSVARRSVRGGVQVVMVVRHG